MTTIALRGGRLTVFAIDLPSLASLGTFLGGFGTLLGVMLAIMRGKSIRDWFSDRRIIIGQRDAARLDLADSQSRERSLRDALASVQSVADSMETANAYIKGKLEEMERRNNAFIGYINAMVQRINEREDFARQKGVDFSALPLPVMPPELKAVLQ